MTSDNGLPDYLRETALGDDPARATIPEAASDEDRDALAAITAEHARLSAKAEQLFGLPSPPPAMLTALADELAREIANFEGQKAMVAGRHDLVAFPAMLDRVIGDYAFYQRRCAALQMHLETQAMPWIVTREPGVRSAPPSAAAPIQPAPVARPAPMPLVNEFAEAEARLKARQIKKDAELKAELDKAKVAQQIAMAKYKPL